MNEIEKDIVEEIIKIFKEHYPEINKTTHFIEIEEGITNLGGLTSGFTNIRDAVMHISNICQPGVTYEKRKEILADCTEHLRRAVREPAQKAANSMGVKLKEIYTSYVKYVLPAKEEYEALKSAPSKESINETLKRINDLLITGRETKNKEEWKFALIGRDLFFKAYEEMKNCSGIMQDYINKWELLNKEDLTQREIINLKNLQQRSDRRARTYFVWALIATLVGIILAVIALL